jgi:anti-anti-sigma regulatory factor
MMKIASEKGPGVITLKLEGRIAGPWVHELERTWQETATDRACNSIIVDLCGVTFVDAKARELLVQIHCRGALFKTCGFLMKSIVDEIKEECEGAHQELLHEERTKR